MNILAPQTLPPRVRRSSIRTRVSSKGSRDDSLLAVELAVSTAHHASFSILGAARRLECVRIQERAMPQRPRQRPTTPHQHPPLVLSLAASKSAPSLGATSALLTSAAARRRRARAAEMKAGGDARSACDERRAPRRLQAHRQACPPPDAGVAWNAA